MRTGRAAVIATALLLATTGTVAEAARTPSGIDSRLTLDWEAGQNRKGRPEISGYIYNDYMRAAINVRLLVETLDAQGQVIDRAYGYVVGGIPVTSRSYFVVPLKTAGPAYRVTVTAYEWRDGAAGG
jgi:hypothetical protein